MEFRPVCCVIGAVLINLTLGTFYSIGNVVPYMASYMRNNGNPDATTEYATWITASFLLGQGAFIVVGSYLEQIFDNRVACIVGCAIHCASTYLTMWAINVNMPVVILVYGLGSGMGCGSSYMASIIAAQKWYPTRKGIFTGVIVAGFGLGGLIFTMLQTEYINPNNEPADSSGYFSQSVYEKVPNLFLYMGIIFTVVQTIGCTLAFPPPMSTLTTDRPPNENNTVVVDEALPTMKSASSAFKYRIFYIIGIMMMSVAPGVTFVNSLGKRYGQIYIDNDKFLTIVVAVAAVANASGRLSWGYLADRFSFTTCYTIKVALFATLILMFPFGFILSSKALYLIWMLGLFFGFSGTFVLFPVFIEQVFGARYNGIVYGILYIFLALSSILTSLIIQIGINPKSSNLARILPCAIIAGLYVFSLVLYRLTISVDRVENAVRRKDLNLSISKHSLSNRKDLIPSESRLSKENSLGSIVRFADPP